MRDPNREKIGPFLPFLKLFLSGLYKLTLISGTFSRGIPHEVYADKKEGDYIVMWGFTSATDNISVLQNKQFLGDEGSRSILQFKSGMFVDIRQFSSFPEDERLLLPGTVFILKGRYSDKTGLTILQLVEDPQTHSLLDFPHPIFAEKAASEQSTPLVLQSTKFQVKSMECIRVFFFFKLGFVSLSFDNTIFIAHITPRIVAKTFFFFA